MNTRICDAVNKCQPEAQDFVMLFHPSIHPSSSAVPGSIIIIIAHLKAQTFILSIHDSDWLEFGESRLSRPLFFRGRPRRLRVGHPVEKQSDNNDHINNIKSRNNGKNKTKQRTELYINTSEYTGALKSERKQSEIREFKTFLEGGSSLQELKLMIPELNWFKNYLKGLQL